VTANKNIFCNTPWYEIHIYWDGSLGICCQEAHKLHSDSVRYNVANMSIGEWFNSEPVQNFRQRILGSSRLSECTRCYHDEDYNALSRRYRSNQKSVIFTRTAFDKSFDQSPHRINFDPLGVTTTHPVDIHIDLGNYCNLACKMCDPRASSTIAAQLVKWGDKSALQYLGNDWTKNQAVWARVLAELAAIPNLNNVHFMGGETLITSKFEDFVDYMIEHGRFDLNFSFVTNGTGFNPQLMEKLKRFRRVGIEVSIETVTEHNAYVRQGTDTAQVLDNVKQYLAHCNGTSITVTVRPTISALTIGRYHTLLRFCLEKNLLNKSLVAMFPAHLTVSVLPYDIRQSYVADYVQLLDDFDLHKLDNSADFNDSNPHKIPLLIKMQIEQCISLLNNTDDHTDQLAVLVEQCSRWDRAYNYDAKTLYPELANIFVAHGY
jgi:pyruvate-formate lyase-activating enzyme